MQKLDVGASFRSLKICAGENVRSQEIRFARVKCSSNLERERERERDGDVIRCRDNS